MIDFLGRCGVLVPRVFVALACVAALSACATPASAPATPISPDDGPYASTYAPLPGEPTLLVGATVLTGDGARLENAAVYIADGVVKAVGMGLETRRARASSQPAASGSRPG
jgi:hypothetical protein